MYEVAIHHIEDNSQQFFPLPEKALASTLINGILDTLCADQEGGLQPYCTQSDLCLCLEIRDDQGAVVTTIRVYPVLNEEPRIH